MIDEQRLHDLLELAADEIVVPADGAAVILAVRDRQDRHWPGPRPRRPKRRTLLIVAAAACVVAVVAGVLVFPSGSDTPKLREVAASPRPPSNALAGGAASFGGAASGAAPGTPALPPLQKSAPAVPAANTLTRVVKTGSIDLEVGKDAFASVASRLTGLATGAGGFVTASSTVESGNVPTGTITVRVPVASFEDVLTRVRTLGRVLQVSSKGEDVTAQYVDLDARISALTSSRQQYETLLRKATSIADILNVQQRITDLQTQIEQLQGQQRVLQDQSSLATLEVHLSTPGAASVKLSTSEPSTGLSKAWHRATVRFGDGVEGVVAASGTIAFLVLLGLVLFIVGRLGWPLFRRRLL